MASFRLTLSPNRRAATRFIDRVRRSIQKALAEERRANGLTQSEVARRIGVHRSVINREINGRKDMTLGRVAELANSMGREILFELKAPASRPGVNIQTKTASTSVTTVGVESPNYAVSRAA